MSCLDPKEKLPFTEVWLVTVTGLYIPSVICPLCVGSAKLMPLAVVGSKKNFSLD